MNLALTAEQTMLAKTASDFAAKISPVDRLRELRNDNDELGFTPGVWAEMADLGWLGIPFGEEVGGLDMGASELLLITEALGRGLAPEPIVSAVAFAGRALSQAASDAQKEAWLATTIDGSKRVAVAQQAEGSRYDLARTGVSAESEGDGWTLAGEKIQVMDGTGADALIVSARTSGQEGDSDGVTLFLIPSDRAGVSIERQWRVDSRNAALVRLEGVAVAADDVIGEVGGGHSVLSDAVDSATIALCGEMLGGMVESFERTLAYLREREQFGVKIGTFQALQHRAADLFVEIELARSAAMGAARSFDEEASSAGISVSNAKAKCTDAMILVTNEALQMHGGIGMTDEHDIGLFMKRARVSAMTFGDSGYHRTRFATLSGY